MGQHQDPQALTHLVTILAQVDSCLGGANSSGLL
jgi:hypothetical protein